MRPRSVRLAASVGPATSISPSTSFFSLRTNASTFSPTSVAFAPTDFNVRETTHFGVAGTAEMGRLTYVEVGRRERHTRRGERRRVCAQTEEGRRGRSEEHTSELQ